MNDLYFAVLKFAWFLSAGIAVGCLIGVFISSFIGNVYCDYKLYKKRRKQGFSRRESFNLAVGKV
jgi:hypothetical protein